MVRNAIKDRRFARGPFVGRILEVGYVVPKLFNLGATYFVELYVAGSSRNAINVTAGATLRLHEPMRIVWDALDQDQSRESSLGRLELHKVARLNAISRSIGLAAGLR